MEVISLGGGCIGSDVGHRGWIKALLSCCRHPSHIKHGFPHTPSEWDMRGSNETIQQWNYTTVGAQTQGDGKFHNDAM